MKKILNEWNKFVLKEVSQFRDIMRILSGERQNIQSAGIMTPENPKNVKHTEKQNDEFIKQFQERLSEMGWGYRKIRGKFGNRERSYIIPNVTRAEMAKLGREFKQEAIIWGSLQDERMVYEYIDGGEEFDYIGDGKTLQRRDVVLTGDDVDAKSDFYSQEPGGPEGHRITYKDDPETGERKGFTQGPAKKFVIPFFDAEYDFEEEGLGEGILPELDLTTERELYEDTKKRLKRILKKNATKKSIWQNRRIIKYNYNKRTNNT